MCSFDRDPAASILGARDADENHKRIKTDTETELPDEIMTELLLRLPVKSILRFRAVCRAWAATLGRILRPPHGEGDPSGYDWAFGLPEKFGSGISGFENFGF